MNIVQRAMRELGLAGAPRRSGLAVQASIPAQGETHFLRTKAGALGDDGPAAKPGFFRARLNARSDSGHSKHISSQIADADADFSDSSVGASGSPRVRSAFVRRTGLTFALVFVSRSTGQASAHDQLRELRRWCRVRNESLGIASAIVMQDGMFCQWLEGSKEVVDAIYHRIKSDSRHEAVMCLYRGEVQASMLDSWCMGIRSLSMSTNDAFVRACELRRGVEGHAYSSPHAAWIGFAGLQGRVHGLGLDSSVPDHPTRRGVKSRTRSICVISHRSALSSQLLVDANRACGTQIVIGRWGGEADSDSDLQSAEAVVNLGGEPVRMLCTSFRSLRVGILREKVMRASEIVLALPQDDMNELESQLTLLAQTLASSRGARLVSVLAPTWNVVTTAHAMHLLKINQFAGQTHEINLFDRGCWTDFANAVGHE